ncbi:MAG: hypothetical protein WCI36_03015 [bacterium]
MLTEKSKVKNYLGISDESHDDLFDDLCAGISQFIVTYCDRDILTIPAPTEPDAEQAFYEEYFDSDANEELMLRNYPVRTLLKVEYNSRTQDDPLWVELEPSRYVIYWQGGIVHLYGKFPVGLRQNIKVTYNGGFDEAPADIAMVATELVAKLFEKRKAQGKSSESLGGARIDWINELTKEQKIILDNYAHFPL